MYIDNVASTAAMRKTRTNAPLMSPTATATPITASRPSSSRPVPWPSEAKNENTTTVRPLSGPTDRSIPPVSSTISCPKLISASALASSSMPWKFSSVRKRPFEALV